MVWAYSTLVIHGSWWKSVNWEEGCLFLFPLALVLEGPKYQLLASYYP